MFRELSRDARAWLKGPADERAEALLRSIAEQAASVTTRVPEARRADWAKLVGGFASTEPDARRRARVEGLVRACHLFDAKPAPRLEWHDPVERVRGLGPAASEALSKIGTTTVADLVWTLPVAWDDARAPIAVGSAATLARATPHGVRVCLRGLVKSAGLVPMRGKRVVRVVVVDASADGGAGDGESARSAARSAPKESLVLWWFFAAHGVLTVATPGSSVIVTGQVRADPGKPPRMVHPEVARDDEQARVVRPRYARSSVRGVAEGTLRKAIVQAFEGLDALLDFVPEPVASREAFPPADEVLLALHGRQGGPPRVPDRAARLAGLERLAWAEAFTRAWQRVTLDAEAGGATRALALPVDRAVLARLRAELGFSLTSEQDEAIDLVSRDLARPTPMRRLLLGDVGTGKTIVALAAAAQCVSAGAQVAILAPTSILAEQYMDAVGPLARATGASVALLAAGVPAPQRRRREDGLARGTLSIAVGTHALLGDAILFKKLGLVIVDEQHRLGVAQRLALVSKGKGRGRGGTRPHLLTLSATPIPRTLALALRGELKTCELGDRPKGRPAVVTELRSRAEFASVVAEIRGACARGERAFVVAPRIDEADEGDAGDANAVELASTLGETLAPHGVGLVHGGLSADEKNHAMRSFRAGETLVLVGTTVVEVGLDVPQATLMVVCDAERFGLAQLHQLRGRVGRGDRPGRCILVHAASLDALAEARLRTLAKLDRGIDVARADLELRGAGDLGGTRQSGAGEELLYLDPTAPPAWLARIDGDARAIFAVDPSLANPEHRALGLAVRRFATAIAVREEAG